MANKINKYVQLIQVYSLHQFACHLYYVPTLR